MWKILEVYNLRINIDISIGRGNQMEYRVSLGRTAFGKLTRF